LSRFGHPTAMPRLNHVALAVRNPSRSLRFYRGTIGVEGTVREESYGFVITTCEGLTFTLFDGEPPNRHGEFHIGVSLPDGEAVRAKREVLLAAQVPEIEWSDMEGYVSMKVRDPDGYAVEIAWDEKYASG
jgi:catechol 2,3-dioxygenase-like lactoylglutathione lyase family enzyme